MARESKEEAGITIAVDDLALVLTMHRKADDERLSMFFEASTWCGDVKNMEPNKCDDLAWFDLLDLPSNTVPYIAAAIKSIQGGHQYFEFGW